MGKLVCGSVAKKFFTAAVMLERPDHIAAVSKLV
jgi:hypothetical protein